MKTLYTFILITVCTANLAFAQNEMKARMEYEDAETAYSNRNYRKTIEHLDNAERLLGTVTAKTEYLRIMSLDKLISPNNYQWTDLEKLINSCKHYLDTYTNADSGKYRDVYEISTKLKDYPKSYEEYQMMLDIKKENERKRQEEEQNRRRIEEQQRQARLEKEKLERERKLQQEVKEKEKELRKNGYATFAFGASLPTSSDTKSNITLSQWESNQDVSPFITSYRTGKMGIKAGVHFGFEGIAGLNKLNEKIKAKRICLGLIWDVKQTFLFYNFNNVKNSSSYYDYFEGSTKKPFAISTFGFGPAFSLRLGKNKTFLDLFVKADLNLFYWGGYSAETDDQYNYYYPYTFVKGKTNGVRVGGSPTFGAKIRWEHFFLGFEYKLGLRSNKEITHSIKYSQYSSGYLDKYQDTNYKTLNGLDLSQINFTIGFPF